MKNKPLKIRSAVIVAPLNWTGQGRNHSDQPRFYHKWTHKQHNVDPLVLKIPRTGPTARLMRDSWWAQSVPDSSTKRIKVAIQIGQHRVLSDGLNGTCRKWAPLVLAWSYLLGKGGSYAF